MANDPDSWPAANLRASHYFIARTSAPCIHCGASNTLTALALAAGHEVCDEDSDDWQPVEANAFCFHVAAVSAAVYRRLLEDAPDFRFVANATGGSCWANHCRQCGRVVDEEELHAEPGAHGFVPCNERQAAQLTLLEVNEPFEASAGGYAPEPEYFAFMRRV